MDKSLADKITSMATPANPTEADIATLLSEWDIHFKKFNILPAGHEQEFDAIMRSRVFSGCISLRAPDDPNLRIVGGE